MAAKWEDLRDASFRGVPFFFRDVEGLAVAALSPRLPQKRGGLDGRPRRGADSAAD
jgi:hypothetical protein